MQVPNYVAAYQELLVALTTTHGRDRAMELVVGGGGYEQIGILESSALICAGLQPTDSMVDVGCGSGRLAVALKDWLKGKYIGTDVLPEVLDYARERTAPRDWSFLQTSEPTIPIPDQSVEFVSFFSVFTHLLDEEIYLFLHEAKRVGKLNARIVFSYLDFEVDSHWPVFEQTVANRNPNRVINKFLSKTAINRWARALGLTVEQLIDGPTPWINLTRAFTYEDGRFASGVVEFGQSVAILRVH